MRKKVKSPASLARELKRNRRGRKYVFTNGCFDIIHRGHVSYLEKAKTLGTHLIVALNADASVRRLKGKGRPLNPLADRMEVMAALESVDYVTWFEEDTPLKIIRALLPDVLAKGGDWKASQIVGASDVIRAGGKVRSLLFVPGRSTTRIIARARRMSVSLRD